MSAPILGLVACFRVNLPVLAIWIQLPEIWIKVFLKQ